MTIALFDIVFGLVLLNQVALSAYWVRLSRGSAGDFPATLLGRFLFMFFLPLVKRWPGAASNISQDFMTKIEPSWRLGIALSGVLVLAIVLMFLRVLPDQVTL